MRITSCYFPRLPPTLWLTAPTWTLLSDFLFPLYSLHTTVLRVSSSGPAAPVTACLWSQVNRLQHLCAPSLCGRWMDALPSTLSILPTHLPVWLGMLDPYPMTNLFFQVHTFRPSCLSTAPLPTRLDRRGEYLAHQILTGSQPLTITKQGPACICLSPGNLPAPAPHHQRGTTPWHLTVKPSEEPRTA